MILHGQRDQARIDCSSSAQLQELVRVFSRRGCCAKENFVSAIRTTALHSTRHPSYLSAAGEGASSDHGSCSLGIALPFLPRVESKV